MTAIEQQQTTTPGVELVKLWSVTELLKAGLGTSRPLVEWNCEQTAIAALESREVIDAMLKSKPYAEVVKWIKGERWNVSERAKIRGTIIHHAAEAIALGNDPGTIEPQYEPYVEQLGRWLKTWQPEFLLAEAPVYNLTHGYAGTLDGIMALTNAIGGRERLLFDYKTTPKGPEAKSRPPYSDVSLQLAAYAHAELVDLRKNADRREDQFKQRWYMYDPTLAYEPMPPVDGALCIVVSPFDCFAVRVSIGDVPWRAFLHVRATAEWQERQWRNAFGVSFSARAEP